MAGEQPERRLGGRVATDGGSPGCEPLSPMPNGPKSAKRILRTAGDHANPANASCSLKDPKIGLHYLRPAHARGNAEVSRHVKHGATHVEDAVHAQDDPDPFAGDTDGLHDNDDQRQ
jgi:hypothetical protein